MPAHSVGFLLRVACPRPRYGAAAVTTAPYLPDVNTNLRAATAARSPLSTLPLPATRLPGAGPAADTVRSLARRLALALHDLGLAGVVPAGWASADGDTLRFADLGVAAADHLVRHLEDLAAALPAPAPPEPSSDQAALFPAAG